MPPAFSSLAHRGIPDVCTTPNCAQIAESIMSYVNLNVDPCSDFFQYTCKYNKFNFKVNIFLLI